jgi:SAM-dependent methyltransferase
VRFDLVLLAGVLHHVARKDQEAVIKCLGKAMNRKGRLFIFEFNPYNPLTRRVFNRVDQKMDINANLVHPRYIKEKVLKSGFGNARIQYTVFFPQFLSALIPLEKHIGFIPFGAHYYLTAESGFEAEKR